MKKNVYFKNLLIKQKSLIGCVCALALMNGLNSEIKAQAIINSYSFTNAGATGSYGPDQSQINSSYSGTSLNGLVNSNSGIQSFTIPSTSNYSIVVAGAGGGNSSNYGGRGIVISGVVTLNAGTVLKVLVGQKGGVNSNQSAGGGGGSYVAIGSNTPLIVAGGGAGAYYSGFNTFLPNSDGNIYEYGQNSTCGSGIGGNNGNGGLGSNNGWGGGGGGFFTNGTAAANAGGYGYSGLGYAFLNGGYGGNSATSATGGFGGGAGTHGNTGGGGGGGGYSGGGGSNQNQNPNLGGGGGSYFSPSMTNTFSVGYNLDYGYVYLYNLCAIPATPNNITPLENLSICANKSATLSVSGADFYTWFSTPTSTNVIGNGYDFVTPTLSPGAYTYYAAGNNNCSEGLRKAITVTVNAIPSIFFTGGNTAVCPNTSVAITANGATSYSWSNGALSASTVVSPSVTTAYTVIGTTGNCSTTAVKNVSINPTIVVTGNTLLCSGGPAFLSAVGANSYTWSTGSNLSFINVTPTVNTTYTVVGTNPSGPCTNTTVVTVTVSSNPTVNIAGTFTICNGVSSTLTASGANSYTWSNTVTDPSSVYSPTTSSVVVGVTGRNLAGCSTFTTQTITVNPSPFLDVVAPSYVCVGTSATIAAVSPNAITWNTGETTSTIVVSPGVETTYTAVATHTVNSCTRTKTATIKVDPCTSISYNAAVNSDLLVYPNPNNGEFTIELNNNSVKTIEVIDVTGRLVMTNTTSEAKTNVDISSLNNGIYFVKVKSETMVNTIKMIKK